MKQRLATVMAGLAAVTMLAGSAIGEEHGRGMRHDKMMRGKKEMSEKQGMMKDMPMMQGGMMGGMMRREIVATEDGGIVVIQGNILLKYDKKLELVKKTKLDIDEDDMRQMMEKMKKHCGMRRKAMMEDDEEKAE